MHSFLAQSSQPRVFENRSQVLSVDEHFYTNGGLDTVRGTAPHPPDPGTAHQNTSGGRPRREDCTCCLQSCLQTGTNSVVLGDIARDRVLGLPDYQLCRGGDCQESSVGVSGKCAGGGGGGRAAFKGGGVQAPPPRGAEFLEAPKARKKMFGLN